jgi:hypothetical protein
MSPVREARTPRAGGWSRSIWLAAVALSAGAALGLLALAWVLSPDAPPTRISAGIEIGGLVLHLGDHGAVEIRTRRP